MTSKITLRSNFEVTIWSGFKSSKCFMLWHLSKFVLLLCLISFRKPNDLIWPQNLPWGQISKSPSDRALKVPNVSCYDICPNSSSFCAYYHSENQMTSFDLKIYLEVKFRSHHLISHKNFYNTPKFKLNQQVQSNDNRL